MDIWWSEEKLNGMKREDDGRKKNEKWIRKGWMNEKKKNEKWMN